MLGMCPEDWMLGTVAGYQEQYKLLSLKELSKTDLFPPFLETLQPLRKGKEVSRS